jgi:secreted trypsin-like serine protease
MTVASISTLRHAAGGLFGLFASALLASHAVADIQLPRIINGSPASIQTYPWMASLFVDDGSGVSGSGCGASLIHPQWLLTAAHCFLNASGDAVDNSAFTRTSVTLNSATIDGETTAAAADAIRRQVISGVIHPNYNPGAASLANDSDIALLQLDAPVDTLTPISLLLNGSEVAAGQRVIVMGWGATEANGDQTSGEPDQLQQAEQVLVEQTSCAEIYGANTISDNMLCAGGLDGNDTRDSCKGDSGGPLVAGAGDSFVQLGVSSFGGTTVACGDPAVPGVYTRVAAFTDFIREHVPAALFSGLDNGDSACVNTLDAEFNIAIPCLLFADQAWRTSLSFAPQADALVWNWSGSLEPSACPVDASVCTQVDNDLGLSIPGIVYNNVRYTAQLKYLNDAAQSGQERWIYHSLTEQ